MLTRADRDVVIKFDSSTKAAVDCISKTFRPHHGEAARSAIRSHDVRDGCTCTSPSYLPQVRISSP
jgi:hypothetical protein